MFLSLDIFKMDISLLIYLIPSSNKNKMQHLSDQSIVDPHLVGFYSQFFILKQQNSNTLTIDSTRLITISKI